MGVDVRAPAAPSICLLTSGQLSSDPRLVKAADALHGAGYRVQVIAGSAPWSYDRDVGLLARREWRCRLVGSLSEPERYRWTRVRHAGAKRIVPFIPWLQPVARAALALPAPELARVAREIPADMYIAHGIGALPAAEAAARAQRALVGYDAEDFLLGMRPQGAHPSAIDRLVGRLERRYLPMCACLTAASPGIARAYAETYPIPAPTPVLNVFPLAQRPPRLREGRDTGPLTLYWFSQVIGPDRGLEDVVRAMGILHDCDIRLYLQGSWPVDYRDRLLALAGSASIDLGRIRHLATAPPDDLVRTAAQFDIGLSLERRDPVNRNICQTNKLFVCLLAGNALVLTDTAGQRPVACDLGDAAFLYAPGDAAALAAQLRRWYDDRVSLQRARTAAWEAGERRYNWDVEKEVLLGVMSRTLSTATGHHA